MPECGGIEAALKIKKFMNKHLPKAEQSFICCITAYSGKKYEREAKAAGMDYFMNKPIFKNAMQGMLEAAKLLAPSNVNNL